MISMASPTFDLNGHIAIDAHPDNLFDTFRRGSVTATLDGSVSVYDTGYSVADQTIKCTVERPEKSLLQQIRYLIANYAQIILCCEAGAFLSIPSCSTSKTAALLSFRLVRRLN